MTTPLRVEYPGAFYPVACRDNEGKSAYQELERVLFSYPEEELKQAFVVVEPGR